MLIIYIVSCPNLTQPNNGMINCSLGDDRVSSFEDTCSFTCNTGYELIGSETWTCQDDGSWSSSDANCNRGTSQFIVYLLFVNNMNKPIRHQFKIEKR